MFRPNNPREDTFTISTDIEVDVPRNDPSPIVTIHYYDDCLHHRECLLHQREVEKLRDILTLILEKYYEY